MEIFYLIDETGNVVKSLVGHRSRITQLEFKGQYLFSSSYDCTVSLWGHQCQQAGGGIVEDFIRMGALHLHGGR